MTKFNLNENAPIFEGLKELNNSDNWWTRLKTDPDIYIDIRKGDEINIYYNGGSILRIDKKLSNAKINYAFLPIKGDGTYAQCNIDTDGIKLAQKIVIDIDNFSEDKIQQIKRSIRDYYPNRSEKGIQGAYATHHKKGNKEENGFFIDTEFMFGDSRIDLTFLNYKNHEQPKLYFVELKTKDDDRLFEEKTNGKECIGEQLKKYCEFIKENKSELIEYYKKIYRIKKELNLIPDAANKINIDNLTIESKPIFLIGDATEDFINAYEKVTDAPAKVKENSCMRIYRGCGTNYLNFDKSNKNIFN